MERFTEKQLLLASEWGCNYQKGCIYQVVALALNELEPENFKEGKYEGLLNVLADSDINNADEITMEDINEFIKLKTLPTSRTPQEWWDYTKQTPERVDAWLKNQYHGEATAATRIRELIASQLVKDSTPYNLAMRIANDEDKHAEWIGSILQTRGITPEILEKDSRYWDAVLDDEKVEGNGEYAAAIAAHAEEMRLERIKIIMADEDVDLLIKDTFAAIYKDEVFHAKAFKEISGEAYYNSTSENHAKGLEALGLII